MDNMSSRDVIFTVAAIGIFFYMFGFWSAYFIFT